MVILKRWPLSEGSLHQYSSTVPLSGDILVGSVPVLITTAPFSPAEMSSCPLTPEEETILELYSVYGRLIYYTSHYENHRRKRGVKY